MADRWHFKFYIVKNFQMHPLLKRHILFYSNGLAIYHGLPDTRPIEVNIADCLPF